MKVTVKKKSGDKQIPLAIQTDFIKLEAAMKYASVVATGGEAKAFIQEEQVTVNGEVCTMRGKKLYPGDRFSFNGETYVICNHVPL